MEVFGFLKLMVFAGCRWVRRKSAKSLGNKLGCHSSALVIYQGYPRKKRLDTIDKKYEVNHRQECQQNSPLTALAHEDM